ncbi:uncharacterized protein LOC111704840 [Eurytemora carolleeae]|uniref:uncharacterized protein LOC111704840 n=1 Tax=Eurytemora carolleeae TaxID=1294199 RepID=UPI000C786F96|nr:uncharacterized protein LOC111704840 [Eurytemora carolleeae]|eukprot:XP_023332968.1 uncharacterized protein LOC111704840 [Eurytemora affinis]
MNVSDVNIMASASSTSAKILFQDSKQKLSERVQANITSVGSLVRQLQKGSRSNDILGQTVRNFSAAEVSINNTSQQLDRISVLTAQLGEQQERVQISTDKISQVREQVLDMQR